MPDRWLVHCCLSVIAVFYADILYFAEEMRSKGNFYIQTVDQNREIRRRTRVVGVFPDGNSALMLVCAQLRHVAGTQWGSKKYMNMKHLETMEQEPQVG